MCDRCINPECGLLHCWDANKVPDCPSLIELGSCRDGVLCRYRHLSSIHDGMFKLCRDFSQGFCKKGRSVIPQCLPEKYRKLNCFFLPSVPWCMLTFAEISNEMVNVPTKPNVSSYTSRRTLGTIALAITATTTLTGSRWSQRKKWTAVGKTLTNEKDDIPKAVVMITIVTLLLILILIVEKMFDWLRKQRKTF